MDLKKYFSVDVLNPKKSVKSILKTGKTLSRNMKDLEKEKEKKEELKKITSVKIRGRRNASNVMTDQKEKQALRDSLYELRKYKKMLNKEVEAIDAMLDTYALSSFSPV